MTRALKWFRRGLLAGMLALLISAAGSEDYRPSTLELAVAPYKYSLVKWELSHFPDKWLRRLAGLLPGRAVQTRAERIVQAREYFALGREFASLERSLLLLKAGKRTSGATTRGW